MKKIISVLLICLCVWGSIGCGKKEEVKESDYGTYKIVELKNKTDKYDKKTLLQLGIDYELTIIDNKSAKLKMNEEVIQLSYDEKEFTDEEKKYDAIPYSKNGNKITITIDEEQIIFEK